jgi:hypothetical protein
MIRYALVSSKALWRLQAMFVIALMLAGLAICCAVLGWFDRA